MVAATSNSDADPIGTYLASRMSLVAQASPGPLTATRRHRGTVHIASPRRKDRPLATFSREADARLFLEVVSDLRALINVIVELYAGHRDDGHGRCARCGQTAPCPTRRLITSELLPRTAT